MDIGKEEEKVVVEPVKDPVKRPKKTPAPEPVKVPAGVPSAREEARELIAGLLRYGGRERPEIIAEAEARGISEATMLREAQDMGVIFIRNGPRPGIWRLP